MNQIIKKYRAAAAGLALLIVSGLAGIASAQTTQKEDAAPTRSRADSGEIKSCVECHEGYYGILRTKHAVQDDPRTPQAKGKLLTGNPDDTMCGSCHGDLSEHLKTPRKPGLVPTVFGSKATSEPQNEACLSCHQNGARTHWQGSKHDQTKTACASCHRLHASKDPVLVAETQASVCFSCHQDRRAALHRVSTHPTKTGFFACSSCHAPHGSSTRASLQKNSVNETCYQCHAQLRGPFLWEHRSAQDDCTNCHDPHGTNTAPMLKTRMPYLCQQCHQTGHSSTAFGAEVLPGGPSTTNALRVVGNACANCHMKIHGSNHPSGARLQR